MYPEVITDTTLSISGKPADAAAVGSRISSIQSSSGSNDNIADAFSTSKPYVVGNLCIYENTLYKCITAVETAGDLDSSKWKATSVANELNVKYDSESDTVQLYVDGAWVDWRSGVKYYEHVYTTSVDGTGASIKVETIRGGNVQTSNNIHYQSASYSFSLISTSYSNPNWKITALKPLIYSTNSDMTNNIQLAKGSSIQWGYGTWKNYYFKEV